MQRTTEADEPTLPWWSEPAKQAMERLGTPDGGLTQDEAARRLKAHGPNALPRGERTPWYVFYLRQFRSPLIYILAAAAVVALLAGERVDAGFIALVLVINAIIGGMQERKAERGAVALQRLLRIEAAVERARVVRVVDAEALVPGDVVWLESGQRVPADLRLLTDHGLEVDESLLTGESTPVAKAAGRTTTADSPIADRACMAHAGSIVLHGRAVGVVVATGLSTQVGRIAADVASLDASPTPLIVRMARFSRMIGIIMLVLILPLVGLGLLQGYTIREMFLFAVATAVSVIPEGLPVALTIALTVGAVRMARRQVIVRRIAAVEGLGSCTLIATDKTGTLTVNALTVRSVMTADGTSYTVSGEGFEPQGAVTATEGTGDAEALQALAQAAALCNEGSLHATDEGWSWRGDPTDVALLAFVHKAGRPPESFAEAAPQINTIPFEPERRFAASYHRVGGTVGGTEAPAAIIAEDVVFVKGAPERVLSMCRHVEGPEGGSDGHAMWADRALRLAEKGHRVLALATGPAPGVGPADVPEEPRDLRFLGLVGMIDPPRSEVPDAVREAQAAGVRVMMITGDHPATALSIARDLGIASDPSELATGADLEAAGEEGLGDLVARVRVFARVAPHEKLLIVNAARAQGHFVAVTGDGVNDAPALRAANIGVAMGRSGTDVAREAADVVLADDDFASVVEGIREGRVAYDNVRNVVFLLISTGAAELVLLGLALGTGSPIPLLPAQLLWLNLVTNGIQHVGLALEPGAPGVLRRPPRAPNEPIFDPVMIERTLLAAMWMGLVSFFAFDRMLDRGWSVEAARNGVLLLMVLFENVHVGNARSERLSGFRLSPLRNPVLLAGVVLAQVIHIGALFFPPLQTVLRVEPVSFMTWSTLFVVAVSLFVVFELHKALRNRIPYRTTRSRLAAA